jgi:CRP-like cAMP-binding protein
MSKTREQVVREIRDAALELSRHGRHAAALERFGQLERLQPDEADWPRRAAECERLVGNVPRQVAALGRAAELYAQAGAMAKAIAMCRMILALDPTHTQTQERLAALQVHEATVAPPPRVPLAALPRAPALPLASTMSEPRASPVGSVAVPARPRPELGRLLRQRHNERAKPTNATADAGGVETRPSDAVAEVAFPILSEGSLKDLVPNSQAIRGPRGVPSGMHRIDVGELGPPKPAERTRQAAQKALPVTPLFSELGPQSLERLISAATLERFEPGAAVFRQNDAAETLHVIVSGAIALVVEQEQRVEVTRLSEGEFFGEAALMSNEPRQMTAEAVESTDVLSIRRETIRELIADEPRLLTTVLRFLRERLIESSMLTNPIFTILSGVERRLLATHFEFLEIDPGSLVIWQGVRSPGLFVLLSGSAEVIHDDAGDEHLLATLRPGAVFGEMSLLDGGGAVADVRCVSRSYALMLPRADFARVAGDYPSMVEFLRLLAETRRRELPG